MILDNINMRILLPGFAFSCMTSMENYCLLISGGDTQLRPCIYGWILRQVIAILLMMESTSIYGRKA